MKLLCPLCKQPLSSSEAAKFFYDAHFLMCDDCESFSREIATFFKKDDIGMDKIFPTVDLVRLDSNLFQVGIYGNMPDYSITQSGEILIKYSWQLLYTTNLTMEQVEATIENAQSKYWDVDLSKLTKEDSEHFTKKFPN